MHIHLHREEPANFWRLESITDLFPLLTTVAVLVALLGLLQRHRADARTAWWERVRWSAEQALSPSEEHRRAGDAVLQTLLDEGRTLRSDAALFRALTDSLQQSGRGETDDSTPRVGDNDEYGD